MRQQAVSGGAEISYVALTRAKEGEGEKEGKKKMIISCASAQLGTQIARLGRLAALGELPAYAIGGVHTSMRDDGMVDCAAFASSAGSRLRAHSEEQIEIDGKAPDTIQIHCCVPDDGTEIEQERKNRDTIGYIA